MKINYKRFKCLLLLFVIIGLTNCEQTNSTATTHKKEEIKKLELVNKSDGYVIPQTVKHYDDTVMSDKTIILPLGQSMRTSHPILSSPMMRHQITTTTSYMPSHVRVPTCPCAGEVRCKPCNGIVEPNADIYNTPISSCPCAPPISCPRCPPVSLIHEIASKKVLEFLIIDIIKGSTGSKSCL